MDLKPYLTVFMSLPSLCASAAELSALLREMILKLFSEYLSADGKVRMEKVLLNCI